jgi:hypothetical protein
MISHTRVFNAPFLGRPVIIYFWGPRGPGGPKTPSQRLGAKSPICWKGFPGRRGSPGFQNRRFPVRSHFGSNRLRLSPMLARLPLLVVLFMVAAAA